VSLIISRTEHNDFERTTDGTDIKIPSWRKTLLNALGRCACTPRACSLLFLFKVDRPFHSDRNYCFRSKYYARVGFKRDVYYVCGIIWVRSIDLYGNFTGFSLVRFELLRLITLNVIGFQVCAHVFVHRYLCMRAWRNLVRANYPTRRRSWLQIESRLHLIWRVVHLCVCVVTN